MALTYSRLMAKRGRKNNPPPPEKLQGTGQPGSQATPRTDAPTPRRTPGTTPPQHKAAGWKAPLALALIVAAAAGASMYIKLKKPDPSATAAAQGDQQLFANTVQIGQPPDMKDNTGAAAGYIGSATCAECHQGITESYNHIAMGRSMYPPTAENMVEDYTVNNTYYHQPSNMHFRMTHDNGKFYQESYQLGPDGNPTNQNKVEITYIVGSGNNSRSYLHRQANGALNQLPVAWYAEKKNWAMNPGYDNAHHVNFSRRITYDCLFCHAAYPELEPGADRYNYGEAAFFPEHLQAIDCERCHGPAAEHVKLAQAGSATADAIKKSIVNPANLSNELQLETCMQCHLETTSDKLPHSVHTVEKGIFSYRPGEPLESYRYAFDHPPGTGHDDKFEIAGQAYRMRMSACFTESQGKMTCTTCHDPHKVPVDRIEAGIQSCFECHAAVDCTEKMDLRLPVKDNCIQCHMPQRRTDDVIHAVMTDHFIQRRPPPAEQLLAPRKEHSHEYKGDVMPYYPKEIALEVRDLYLGLAHISNSADLDKGIKHLDAYIKQNPNHFPAVYTRGVARKMLNQLDNARRELEAAVKLEPTQPQAWMALGDLYEMMKRYPDSIACYQKAQKIDPRLTRPYNGEGTSHLLKGDLAAAEKCFRTAVTRDPFDENPRLNLAGIYIRRGELKSAEAEARAALAINPNIGDGWLHLAQCTLGDNRPVEAIWNSMQCLATAPHNAQAFEILTVACRAAGADAALRPISQSAERAQFPAYVMTSLLELERGRRTAVNDNLSSASAVTTTAAALPTAARVALAADRPDLALNWGEQAYNALPGNEDALIRYCEALQAMGRATDADKLLSGAMARQRTPRVVNALAWLKATSADDAVRSGTQAAHLAEEATRMLQTPNIFIKQSQAAAAAELGDFTKAVAIATDALNQATQANLTLDARDLQKQLTAYQAQKPYRR